jgi:hypothetical protein
LHNFPFYLSLRTGVELDVEQIASGVRLDRVLEQSGDDSWVGGVQVDQLTVLFEGAFV